MLIVATHTRRHPYDRGAAFDQGDISRGLLRPTLSEKTTPAVLRDVAERAWAQEPSERPMFEEMTMILQALREELRQQHSNALKAGEEDDADDDGNPKTRSMDAILAAAKTADGGVGLLPPDSDEDSGGEEEEKEREEEAAATRAARTSLAAVDTQAFAEGVV